MSRFIDADIPRKELCDWLHRNYVSTEGGQWDDGTGETIAECINEIDKAPTADVEHVIYGHWENVGTVYGHDDMNAGVCSACGLISTWFVDSKEPKRCSNCGAHMHKEENNE